MKIICGNGNSMPRLNRHHAAILGLYFGVMLGPYEDMINLGSVIMDCTMQAASFTDRDFMACLKRRLHPYMLAICAEGEPNTPDTPYPAALILKE